MPDTHREMPLNPNIRAADSPVQDESALFTDLYELTMLAAYAREEMTDDAVFSLFVRRLPPVRNYIVACGLDTVLTYLESLHFTVEEIAYLRSLGKFTERFLASLADFRFTGEVWAVPEGTPLFANEPILEIIAPLPQAQLAETWIMNQVHLQTMLASKASRVVSAAAGRPVVDFGCRRMHGIDAGLKGARAFHIAGVSATSNVLAGQRYRLKVTGTMAHSYIQSHEDEYEAFRAFAGLYPDTVLLVDTYDTLNGVRKVVDLARELGDKFRVRAVRLDSGDLVALSKESRRILDDAGLHKVEIFASGGLDEYTVADLLASGAPIDGFGVGTSMGVSSDAASLDIAYKLCEYAGEGRLKLAPGKPVLPGRKQVFRREVDGEYAGDTIARYGEHLPGRPLLEPVMRDGRRLFHATSDLDAMRDYAQEQVARLPMRLRQIAEAVPPYEVEVSDALYRYQLEITKEVESSNG
jgi:nicotinate phosphoribosyltransferase